MDVSTIKNLFEKCRKNIEDANYDIDKLFNDKYRLWNNNIKMHELNFECIEEVCCGLTHVLVYNKASIINEDHLNFWAWMGQIVRTTIRKENDSRIDYYSSEELQIKMLFSHIIRCALASFELVPGINLPPHTREMVSQSNISVSYLSFPLLEATLRKACKDYVDFSGKVVAPFDIKNKKGKIIDQYHTDKKLGKPQCSNIGHLLHLYSCKDETTKEKMEYLLKYIPEISPNEDVFKTIYIWRNNSLHGDVKAFSNIGGIVLNISLFIILQSIKDDYISYRDKAHKEAEFHSVSSFSIYNSESNGKGNILHGQKSVQ